MPLAPHGLLLAAGAGRRMGRPKALVPGWLDHALAALHDGGCDRVTVVLGAAADEVRGVLGVSPAYRPDDAVVVADDWEQGMGASLRAGIAAAPHAPAVLVHLVDLPDVDHRVVRRVLAAADGPGVLARAAYGDPDRPTLGHPVLLGADHLPGVAAAAEGDAGARGYLRGRDVRAVWCGDLADGADVDTPQG